MSPGIILAALVVAIAAQLTRVLVPGRGNYVIALVCAAIGLLAAELLALAGYGGPSAGAIHPLADVAGIAVMEAIGIIFAAPRRLRGR